MAQEQFGMTRGGRRITESSPEVIAEMQRFPGLNPDAAIGNVLQRLDEQAPATTPTGGAGGGAVTTPSGGTLASPGGRDGSTIMEMFRQAQGLVGDRKLPDFKTPVETQSEREKRIRAQFAPALQRAERVTAEEVEGAQAVGAQRTGENVSTLSLNFVNAVRQRGQQRINEIESKIQAAIQSADFEAAKNFRQAQIDEFNAQRQLDAQALQLFSTFANVQQGQQRIGLEQARLQQQAQQFQQTFGLQRDQFESEQEFNQAKLDMAEREFAQSVQRFGVETALSIAQQNGVEVKMAEDGTFSITDVPTVQRQRQEAEIKRLETLLPLEVNKLIADTARSRAAANKTSSEQEQSDLMEGLREAANMVIQSEEALGGGLDTESYWNIVNKFSEYANISPGDADSMIIRSIQSLKGQPVTGPGGGETAPVTPLGDVVIPPSGTVQSMMSFLESPDKGALFNFADSRQRRPASPAISEFIRAAESMDPLGGSDVGAFGPDVVRGLVGLGDEITEQQLDSLKESLGFIE